MTVHQPHAGIIRREGEHEPAAAGHGGGVAAGRGGEVERSVGGRGWVCGELPASLAEDEEVVAVQVDGVRDWRASCELLDDPVVPHARIQRRDGVV